MAKSKRHNKKDHEQPDGVQGPKPKPTKAELEEDLRLPASFEQTVKALFASDRKREGQEDGASGTTK